MKEKTIRDHHVVLFVSSDSETPEEVWPALRTALEGLFQSNLGERGTGPANTVLHQMSVYSATRGTPDAADLADVAEKIRVEYRLTDPTASELRMLYAYLDEHIPASVERPLTPEKVHDYLSNINE